MQKMDEQNWQHAFKLQVKVWKYSLWDYKLRYGMLVSDNILFTAFLKHLAQIFL